MMVSRLAPCLLSLLLMSVGCANDQTLSVELTPTPGEATPTPDEPTPEPIPIIRVTPAEVDFGIQGIGCRVGRTIELHNDGGGTLTVYSAALSIASSVDFEVPEGDLISVAPDTSEPLTVFYEVDGSGEDTGTLLIQSNDQEAGTVTIPLKGEAAENISSRETFTQGIAGAVDVLLLIDVTSYATDYVGALALNINLLVGFLDAAQVPWQLAYVTTDPADGAGFGGSFTEAARPYITSDDPPEAIEDFKAAIGQRLALPSSSRTPGLQILNASLDVEKLSGIHAGFVRDEALLSIVTASVYDDDSESAQRLPVPVSDLADILSAVKEDPEDIRFDAVVGERTGSCAREIGQRYAQMASTFGGITEDICFHSWNTTLETLSREMQQLDTIFSLSDVPEDPSSLVVTVGGLEVLRDAEVGWTYDSDLNAIVFNGSSIPTPDSEIVVTFQRGGSCNEQ